MMAKENESEQYLKYPLRLQWGNFTATITQVGRRFSTQLAYVTMLDEFLIKCPVSHLTLHLALLWANNELDCLEQINTGDKEEGEWRAND